MSRLIVDGEGTTAPGPTTAPSPLTQEVVAPHRSDKKIDAGELSEPPQAEPLPGDASWWTSQFDEGWSVADLALRLATNHMNIYHHLKALEIAPPASQSAEKWIEARTTRDGSCLRWTRAFLHGRPVGKADGVHGRTVRRIVWEQAVGPIPDEAWIVRIPECPNEDCVAVHHLRAVSPHTHITERVHALRFRWGEEHGNAKLSDADARNILESRSSSAGELATHFGVSQSTVYAIWAGRRWGHLKSGHLKPEV